MDPLPIEISKHAREQMQERGVVEDEVIAAMHHGESEPARGNRTLYRKNFQFDKPWRGRYYRIKQVAPIVVRESDRLVVVPVFAFYF